MKEWTRGLVVALFVFLLAASAWADSPRPVTIPVSGEYWDSAAGGMLVYSGAVTFDWLQPGSTADGWPVRMTFVGQAWCKNTGAGYTLYGVSTDGFSGSRGGTAQLWQSIVAVGGNGRPAFSRNISIAFSLGEIAVPPTVTEIAFVGR